MTQLNNSVLWPETLLVNLMANFWWSTWCLVLTIVFHCCLCHVGPQLKKTFGPGRICRIWKNRIRCNPNLFTYLYQSTNKKGLSTHIQLISWRECRCRCSLHIVIQRRWVNSRLSVLLQYQQLIHLTYCSLHYCSNIKYWYTL